MKPYQEDIVACAHAAKADPRLFPEHFVGGVPGSLAIMEEELTTIIEIMDSEESPAVWRDAAENDLRKVKEAIAIYADARRRGLHNYRSALLVINGEPVAARWFGQDDAGNALFIETLDERNRWSPSTDAALVRAVAKRKGQRPNVPLAQ